MASRAIVKKGTAIAKISVDALGPGLASTAREDRLLITLGIGSRRAARQGSRLEFPTAGASPQPVWGVTPDGLNAFNYARPGLRYSAASGGSVRHRLCGWSAQPSSSA